MSELTGFRNHCRRMAVDGDVTVQDAQLWHRLADEVDRYLAGDPDVVAPVAQAEDVALWS